MDEPKVTDPKVGVLVNQVISEEAENKLLAQTTAIAKTIIGVRNFNSTQPGQAGVLMCALQCAVESGVDGVTIEQLFEKSKEAHKGVDRYMTLMIPSLTNNRKMKAILLKYNAERNQIIGTFNTMQDLPISVAKSMYQAPASDKPASAKTASVASTDLF